jgi:hypothetical protein
VARSARLRFALLAGAVVVAHVVGLEWLAREADAISGLPSFAPTLYTRMLKPATPPPVVVAAAPVPVAQPRPRAAPKPRPPASSPEELRRKKEREEAEAARREAEREQEAQRERAEREQQLAQAAQAARQAASAAAAAASAASAAAAADQAAMDRWPTDTRLTYRLGGEFRSGPLFGDARVQWQRDGAKYQVRLDVKVKVFGSQVLTSQGEVTPNGLLPRAYEELRPGKRRFAQIGDEVVVLENGRTVPRPPGVQDTASQFVELSQRFATGKEVLEVGRSVTLWLARPGGVDRWVYDVVALETLRTPQLGEVPAYHLKPRPMPNARGNIYAEMWFAPSLQYLPVRIKVLMGNEAYLDLVVDHIEQR